jgi:hypothetical protein
MSGKTIDPCLLEPSRTTHGRRVATGFGPFTALVCPWMDNGTLTSYLEHNREQLLLRDRLELVSHFILFLRHSTSVNLLDSLEMLPLGFVTVRSSFIIRVSELSSDIFISAFVLCRSRGPHGSKSFWVTSLTFV